MALCPQSYSCLGQTKPNCSLYWGFPKYPLNFHRTPLYIHISSVNMVFKDVVTMTSTTGTYRFGPNTSDSKGWAPKCRAPAVCCSGAFGLHTLPWEQSTPIHPVSIGDGGKRVRACLENQDFCKVCKWLCISLITTASLKKWQHVHMWDTSELGKHFYVEFFSATP